MWSYSPTFPGRIVYSENALNTWDGGMQKHVVFPLKDITGAVVPNAYLVGTEEATNNDFQDYVYIIRNVAPYRPRRRRATSTSNGDSRRSRLCAVAQTTLASRSPCPNENLTLGMVTQEDYDTWRANFGTMPGSAPRCRCCRLANYRRSVIVVVQNEVGAVSATAFASLDDVSPEVKVDDELSRLLASAFSKRDLSPFRRGAASHHHRAVDVSVQDIDLNLAVQHRGRGTRQADFNVAADQDASEAGDRDDASTVVPAELGRTFRSTFRRFSR